MLDLLNPVLYILTLGKVIEIGGLVNQSIHIRIINELMLN